MAKRVLVKCAAAMIAVVFIFGMAAICQTGMAEAAKKKTSAAKKDNAKKESIQAAISRNLGAGKPVLLYFYADRIKDSEKNLKEAEKAASKIKGVVLKVEAEKEQEIRFDYGLDYVPTVFVMKPGLGIVDTFVVDNIVEKELLRNTGKGFKPSPGIEAVRKNVAAKKPSLLFFMADWCGYCRHTIPEVESFRKDYSEQVNVVQINLDLDHRAGDLYLVEGVPVLVALDANGAVYRRTGYPAGYSEFEKIFREMGVKLTKKSTSGSGK